MSLAKRALELKDTNPLKKEVLDFLSGKKPKEEKVSKPRVKKPKNDSTIGFIF